MVHLANFNGVSETLPTIPKLTNRPVTPRRAKIVALLSKKRHEVDSLDIPLQATIARRTLVLALASAMALVPAVSGNGASLAEENWWAIDIPLPVPSVENNIANEKTGTRSFLKKGVYVPDVEVKSRMYRLNKNAFDLLAMEDLIGPDTLNYVRRYLRFKSTFIYYDFDKVISAASVSDKEPLIDLANRLFDNFEQLEEASRKKNLSQTESSYQDTKVLLNEVMKRMG